MELDKAKLKHLIEHWIEHNDSHSRSFTEWSTKIEAAGYADISDDIKKAAEKMNECSKLLEEAKGKIK